MIIFTVIFIAAITFLIGFLVGVSNEPPIKTYKFEAKPDEDLNNLKKEYENFLNYDGSEQQ